MGLEHNSDEAFFIKIYNLLLKKRICGSDYHKVTCWYVNNMDFMSENCSDFYILLLAWINHSAYELTRNVS